MARVPIATTLFALVAGCAAQPVVADPRACVDWKDQLGPQLQARCASCHSGAMPAGNYDLTTYNGALQDANGSIVAASGNASSLLLTTLQPATADTTHAAFSDLVISLRSWVVDCDLKYDDGPVHGGGVLNPADPQFHGLLARQEGWDLGFCAKCHGADFGGSTLAHGTAAPSCLTCHKNGPSSCTGCHGEPPASGAHLAHSKGSSLARALDCSECHVKPTVYTDVGHLFDADGGVLPAQAKITFGAFAATQPMGSAAQRTGPPSYNPATQKCSNVYCHGGAFLDASAKRTAPAWTDGAAAAGCDSCHGAPPSNHAASNCVQCHSRVVDATNMKVINASLHVDGKVSLGDDSGTCWACHGITNAPAPPRDLSGDTADDPTIVAIGAHTAHLTAKHHLRGPVLCGDCHVVPTQVGDPGHIDGNPTTKVFPVSDARFKSIATNDGAMPSWSHASATCSAVYCHGGGAKLAADKSAKLNHSPVWTSTSGQADCGVCHGLPPVDASHDATMNLATCYVCHNATIDKTGTLIFDPQTGASTHINGSVETNAPQP